MARYLYGCDPCQKQFEVEKNMSQAGKIEKCPSCGGPGKRIFTAPGLSLKTYAEPACEDEGPACEGCQHGCGGE